MRINSPIDPFIKEQGVLILDGGLATELEKRGHNLDHPLWSARLMINNPEEIYAVHLSYLEAGADCIISSSYQATIAGFISEGLNKKEAKSLIKSTIKLAGDARDEFVKSHHDNTRRIKPIVAASIGPYGAYLANGSEYTGNYNISSDDLKRFHETRWELLTQTSADLFACESIPSIREAEVIRDLLEKSQDVTAWVSFTCRDDHCISDGTPVEDCAALFEDNPNVLAVGVNCTSPKYILSLIKTLSLHSSSKNIVVYPNSGEIYDPLKKQWYHDNISFHFSRAALEWFQAGARLIGGCCRTGPTTIKAIRNTLLRKHDLTI